MQRITGLSAVANPYDSRVTIAEATLRAQAEGQLQTLLKAEGIEPRAVYRPGEVCRLLRISPTTLRQFCELSEHPAVIQREPRALDSFLVGCHHRIAHAALVEWLARNQKFQREG
ncbi:MAG: helix-turn-helix domain-containing protein [Candidatus Competibacteraceae bacterium]|nr:helix-turn-helix domain-containing protein [Candidatus Competibacteraceae bacterium]